MAHGGTQRWYRDSCRWLIGVHRWSVRCRSVSSGLWGRGYRTGLVQFGDYWSLVGDSDQRPYHDTTVITVPWLDTFWGRLSGIYGCRSGQAVVIVRFMSVMDHYWCTTDGVQRRLCSTSLVCRCCPASSARRCTTATRPDWSLLVHGLTVVVGPRRRTAAVQLTVLYGLAGQGLVYGGQQLSVLDVCR